MVGAVSCLFPVFSFVNLFGWLFLLTCYNWGFPLEFWVGLNYIGAALLWFCSAVVQCLPALELSITIHLENVHLTHERATRSRVPKMVHDSESFRPNPFFFVKKVPPPLLFIHKAFSRHLGKVLSFLTAQFNSLTPPLSVNFISLIFSGGEGVTMGEGGHGSHNFFEEKLRKEKSGVLQIPHDTLSSF